MTTRSDVPKISSELSTVELLRTCRRIDEHAIADAVLLLQGIDLLPVDRSVIEHAAVVGPSQLRSLDAIHLASALSVQSDLVAFVAYDTRLGSAASSLGLEVASPR